MNTVPNYNFYTSSFPNSITHTLLEHTFKYIYELYNENKTLLRGLVNVEWHFAGKLKRNSSQSTLTRSFHSLALEL